MDTLKYLVVEKKCCHPLVSLWQSRESNVNITVGLQNAWAQEVAWNRQRIISILILFWALMSALMADYMAEVYMYVIAGFVLLLFCFFANLHYKRSHLKGVGCATDLIQKFDRAFGIISTTPQKIKREFLTGVNISERLESYRYIADEALVYLAGELLLDEYMKKELELMGRFHAGYLPDSWHALNCRLADLKIGLPVFELDFSPQSFFDRARNIMRENLQTKAEKEAELVEESVES